MNTTQNVDDEVYMGFFPPSDDYFTDLLQDKSFKNFLLSDGSTKEGQDKTELQIFIKLQNCGNRWKKANVIMKDTSNF